MLRYQCNDRYFGRALRFACPLLCRQCYQKRGRGRPSLSSSIYELSSSDYSSTDDFSSFDYSSFIDNLDDDFGRYRKTNANKKPKIKNQQISTEEDKQNLNYKISSKSNLE